MLRKFSASVSSKPKNTAVNKRKAQQNNNANKKANNVEVKDEKSSKDEDQQNLSLKVKNDHDTCDVINILIDTLSGEQWTLYAMETDPIHSLKVKIQQTYAIPIKQQMLFLNNEPLDDQRALSSYAIKSGTKLKLCFTSYHEYKQMQDVIVNGVKAEANEFSNKISTAPKRLKTILSTSQNLMQNTLCLSSLLSLKRDTSSEIAAEIAQLFGGSYQETFAKKAADAKHLINVNHANKLSDCERGKEKYVKEIHKIKNEMDNIQKEIDLLQKEHEQLQQLKASKQAFRVKHCESYKVLYEAVRDKNVAAIERNVATIEDAYQRCVRGRDHKEQLKHLIEEKRTFLFEKEYKDWNGSSTISWIKSIENGYFDDKRFDSFMNTLKDLEIAGTELNKVNELFLRSKGMEEEKDQSILLKHIDRIVEPEDCVRDQDKKVCRLCKTNAVNTVIVPCGHACVCLECSKKKSIQKCVICETKVAHIIEIRY